MTEKGHKTLRAPCRPPSLRRDDDMWSMPPPSGEPDLGRDTVLRDISDTGNTDAGIMLCWCD